MYKYKVHQFKYILTFTKPQKVSLLFQNKNFNFIRKSNPGPLAL